MQLWPTERADQEVLWLEEGWGGAGALLAGGCLAAAALLCLLKSQGPYLFEAAGG